MLVVNAGSNEISALQAGAAGLKLISKVPSGGTFPNSIAFHENLAYVLNARSASIKGFRVSSTGVLQEIIGSKRVLPGGSAAEAHDIRFTRDGTRLLVSEGGTNQIDIFELNNQGVVTSVTEQASAGSGPFGMAFGRGGILFNSEANTGSVSSYDLTPEDMLMVISGAVPDMQKASCWISVTSDRRLAFVSNTGSGTISSYAVAKDGTLHVEKIKAGVIANGAPIDSAFATGDEFFYVVDSALGRVVGFRVSGASLAQIAVENGLPQTVQGIAAK
jgi:6-phosphogluconolactonase (cycloisomerase 2 family)